MENTQFVPVDSETTKLKRHRLRRTFIILGSIVLCAIIFIGATGLYRVPGISAIFVMDKPKDLGIEVSDTAFASIKAKIPMKISGEPVDYATAEAKAFTGMIAVNTETTSEEITSWLARNQGADPMFTDTQVRKVAGSLEISTMLQKYLKAPIYVRVSVSATSPKSVALSITQAKVGVFTLPKQLRDQAQTYFQNHLNRMMQVIPGFTIERYEIHDGYSSFKGTFPATVAPSRQGWSGLLSL